MNNESNVKTRYKMYKSGKHWVYAGVMFIAAPMLMLMGTPTAMADTNVVPATTAHAESENVQTKQDVPVEQVEGTTTSTEQEIVEPQKSDETTNVSTTVTKDSSTVVQDQTAQDTTIKETEAKVVQKQAETPKTDNYAQRSKMKQDAVDKVEALPNLTEAQRTALINAIDKVSAPLLPLGDGGQKEVDQLVSKAQSTDQIMQLGNLTTAERDYFAMNILKVTGDLIGQSTGDKVAIYVRQATRVDQVRGMTGLTDAYKNLLSEQLINASSDSAEVHTITRAKGIATVSGMTSLTRGEK